MSVPLGTGLSDQVYLEGKAWATGYALDDGFNPESLLEQPVRLFDLDSLGHVNNSRYSMWNEACSSTWNAAVAKSIGAAQKEGDLVWAVVTDMHVKHCSPATFPDIVLCAARLANFDEKHFSLDYIQLSCRTRKVVSLSNGNFRAWDPQTSKPTTFSKAYLDRLHGITKEQEEQRKKRKSAHL